MFTNDKHDDVNETVTSTVYDISDLTKYYVCSIVVPVVKLEYFKFFKSFYCCFLYLWTGYKKSALPNYAWLSIMLYSATGMYANYNNNICIHTK